MEVISSNVNPFDKSYNYMQNEFDSSVMELLSSAGNFTVSRSQSFLITNLPLYEIEPNTWIMEQLVNGNAEISSATMVLSPGITYSAFYSFGIGYFRPLVFYKAKSVREEYNIYYIPFSSDVWICLFGLLLIITATLTFILARESKLPHDTPYDIIAKVVDEQHDHGIAWNEAGSIPPKETLLQRERWEMGEILLVAIGAICQQGSARDPSTSAARMLLLVMLLLAALAYTAYSASIISLVSLLPSTESERKITSTNLFKERNIALQDTNFFRHSFQSELTKGELLYEDIEKGLEKAINGKAVFVADQDPSLTFVHRNGYTLEERCSLMRAFVGVEYQRVFAIRKNSSLKEVINRNLVRLHHSGLLSREKKRFFKVRFPCTFKERSSISGFVSFDFDDITPALSLFCAGVLSSTILLFLELSAFSSSKIIKRMCSSPWTANDSRIMKLISALLQSKNEIHRQKRNGDQFATSLEKELEQNRLPFVP